MNTQNLKIDQTLYDEYTHAALVARIMMLESDLKQAEETQLDKIALAILPVMIREYINSGMHGSIVTSYAYKWAKLMLEARNGNR